MALETLRMREWRWLRAMNVALLLAFALRALVPTGYMPDFSALSKGGLSVVICSGTGIKTVLLDDDGNPLPAHGKTAHHHHPCAFSGLAAVTVASVDTAVLPQTFENSVAIWSKNVSQALVRVGPPLGSRAPPQLA